MSRFESRKAIWFSLVLITALSLATWAFFSTNKGISSTTTKDEEKQVKEKEIEVKVLDKDKKDAESAQDRSTGIEPRKDMPKDLDQYIKDFELTQRQMEKMMEKMQRA